MAARKRGPKTSEAQERAEARSRASSDKAKVRELEKKLREAKREQRERAAKTVREWKSDKAVRERAESARQKVSDFFENVNDELKLHDIAASYRVVINRDMTIDAEIRVPFPKWVTNVDKATDVLNLLEELMSRVPEMQHISVGFTLNPRANEKDVRASVLQYLKYQGELRLNPNYYDTETGQALSFQVAYDVLRNVTKAHGMLPTGMLVRLTWSPDGWLRRQNDYELRRKLGESRTSKARRKKRAIER